MFAKQPSSLRFGRGLSWLWWATKIQLYLQIVLVVFSPSWCPSPCHHRRWNFQCDLARLRSGVHMVHVYRWHLKVQAFGELDKGPSLTLFTQFAGKGPTPGTDGLPPHKRHYHPGVWRDQHPTTFLLVAGRVVGMNLVTGLATTTEVQPSNRTGLISAFACLNSDHANCLRSSTSYRRDKLAISILS